MLSVLCLNLSILCHQDKRTKPFAYLQGRREVGEPGFLPELPDLVRVAFSRYSGMISP